MSCIDCCELERPLGGRVEREQISRRAGTVLGRADESREEPASQVLWECTRVVYEGDVHLTPPLFCIVVGNISEIAKRVV